VVKQRLAVDHLSLDKLNVVGSFAAGDKQTKPKNGDSNHQPISEREWQNKE
jgi:hypothetical protein